MDAREQIYGKRRDLILFGGEPFLAKGIPKRRTCIYCRARVECPYRNPECVENHGKYFQASVVEHVLPVSRFGLNENRVLAPSCDWHNSCKADATITEWLGWTDPYVVRDPWGVIRAIFPTARGFINQLGDQDQSLLGQFLWMDPMHVDPGGYVMQPLMIDDEWIERATDGQ